MKTIIITTLIFITCCIGCIKKDNIFVGPRGGKTNFVLDADSVNNILPIQNYNLQLINSSNICKGIITKSPTKLFLEVSSNTEKNIKLNTGTYTYLNVCSLNENCGFMNGNSIEHTFTIIDGQITTINMACN